MIVTSEMLFMKDFMNKMVEILSKMFKNCIKKTMCQDLFLMILTMIVAVIVEYLRSPKSPRKLIDSDNIGFLKDGSRLIVGVSGYF